MKLVKVFKENKQFTLFSILALVVVGVAVFAPQIAVMYLGNIVEVIPGEDVTEHAVHPSIYTGTSGCTVLYPHGSQPEDPEY